MPVARPKAKIAGIMACPFFVVLRLSGQRKDFRDRHHVLELFRTLREEIAFVSSCKWRWLSCLTYKKQRVASADQGGEKWRGGA